MPSRLSPRARWSICSAFFLLWTILLLVPIPDTGPLEDLPPGRREIVAKFVHVITYALLAVMGGWLHVTVRWRWALLFVLMAHGTLTELLQTQVGRGGSLGDVGWDHLGVLLGLAATWKWWSRPE
jgi:VanZ family protein